MSTDMKASEFLEVLRAFPTQFADGFKLAAKTHAGGARDAVFAGMGGSAFPADLLNAFLGTRFLVHRSYGLPSGVGRNTLVFANSYSGNTEETIDAAREALARRARVVCITSGGELKELAARHRIPLILLPIGLPPRCATGFFFSAMLRVLENSGLAPNREREVLAAASALAKKRARIERAGAGLAKKLFGKIILVYAPAEFEAVARVCKIKFNENAKTPAFHAVFPELDHNELTGFSRGRYTQFAALFLFDERAHPRVLKRMALTKKLFEERGIEVIKARLEGKTFLEKALHALWPADFASFNLARAYGVEPAPVELTEELKKALRK